MRCSYELYNLVHVIMAGDFSKWYGVLNVRLRGDDLSLRSVSPEVCKYVSQKHPYRIPHNIWKALMLNSAQE